MKENGMKKLFAVIVAIALVSVFVIACYAKDKGSAGEALFKEHCAVCHPDGNNIVNPAFKLHGEDLKAHGITKASQIVDKMRNPGPGMTKFDEKAISDKDAIKIAEYVLKAFK
jgi:cytochrome c6